MFMPPVLSPDLQVWFFVDFSPLKIHLTVRDCMLNHHPFGHTMIH